MLKCKSIKYDYNNPISNSSFSPPVMNQKELEQIPLQARTVAQDAMLNLLVKHVGRMLSVVETDLRSEFLSALQLKIEAVRNDVALMTFPELPPEQSDLMSSEFQEAFEEIANRVEKALGVHDESLRRNA